MYDNQIGNIRFVETSAKKEISIPSDKNWFLVIVFTPFILIWLLVEFYVIPNFIFSDLQNISTSLFWFLGWTFAGLFAIRVWLWHVAGRTSLIVNNKLLTIKRRKDIFSRTKQFELSKIKNLHIQNRDIETSRYYIRLNYLYTSKTKSVAFNYDLKVIRAVDWLDESDAAFVITKLNQSIP